MTKKNQKTNTIYVRVTDEEKLHWELFAHRCNVSLSELIRRLLNNHTANHLGNNSSDKELILQIARIGNNLNQIARWANTYKGAAEAGEVIASLLQIESALLELKAEKSKLLASTFKDVA